MSADAVASTERIPHNSESMATANLSAYPDWKAPAEDGQVLLWPDVGTLVAQTHENQERLGDARDVMIQNLPLGELRGRMRAFLGAQEGGPLVGTGHQIELYHPGVWAKNLFINELAMKVGGQAYHFAVDTDAPKHLNLRWPGGSEPITDDFHLMTADWAEMLEAPTPAHLSEVEQSFNSAAKGWSFQSMMPEFFSAMRRGILESSELPRVVVNATHQVDWELGLRHHALLASPVWRSPGYLAFAYHVLSRAEEFATVYNATLAEYRREQGIRNAGRPWPDLKVEADRVEVPFWFDALTPGQRARGAMIKRGGKWILSGNGEGIELDPTLEGWEAAERLTQHLRRHNMRLSPRALTLTTFLRLCVVDQFVHGIGGGRYDQVTDRVVRKFFRVEPPTFSVTTATLLFPTAVGQEKVDSRALQREGRLLQHSLADGKKREFVERIRTLPRKSLERRDAFFEMHRLLRENLATGEYKAWEGRVEEAKKVSGVQQDLFDRELFYAIQPRGRLQGLMDRYHRAFSQG